MEQLINYYKNELSTYQLIYKHKKVQWIVFVILLSILGFLGFIFVFMQDFIPIAVVFVLFIFTLLGMKKIKNKTAQEKYGKSIHQIRIDRLKDYLYSKGVNNNKIKELAEALNEESDNRKFNILRARSLPPLSHLAHFSESEGGR